MAAADPDCRPYPRLAECACAMLAAGLTAAQVEAVALLVGLELTTRQAAIRLGVSAAAVVYRFAGACRKLPHLRPAYERLLRTRTRTGKAAGRYAAAA